MNGKELKMSKRAFWKVCKKLAKEERIEDATMLKAWRERYENEITMRTKSRWVDRLFNMVGKCEGRGKKDRKTAYNASLVSGCLS